MKEVIYNYDNLNESDITNYIKRSKMVVENSNNEILVVYSHKNYFLIGGHVEDNESFDECVVREIKEESGVDIPYEKRTPYFSIKYLCKDYPNKGENTKYITNFYSIRYDLQPQLDKINLTEEEKEGNFKLLYIHKDKIIDVLTDGLKDCTKENVIKDTIDAIKVYLDI